MLSNDMNTISNVLDHLKVRNMDMEFQWTKQGLKSEKGKIYNAQALSILRTYRFEGASDPDDSAILYIISASDGTTGYSLDAYGTNSNYDAEYDNFIRNIPIVDHNDQIEFDL